MKRKLFMSVFAGITAVMLSACGAADNPAPGAQAQEPAIIGAADTPVAYEATANEGAVIGAFVTVRDTLGNEVVVQQYPTTMAVYDFSILDMIYDIGFERTGINRLITPNQDGLPDALSFFRDDDTGLVVTGGSLHFVDWDVLDLLQPEVVVLGARSFGMNAAGERLSPDERAVLTSDTEERYSGTSFIRLAVSTTDPDFLGDMEANAVALAGMFPSLSNDILGRLESLQNDIVELREEAQQLDETVLVITMDSPTTISVNHPGSRFGMIYDQFGFTPVDSEASGDAATVSAEYVLRQNPDIIFLMAGIRGSDSGPAIENFLSDPSIAQTTAGQNNRIYLLTPDAWHTMTGGFGATEQMLEDLRQALN